MADTDCSRLEAHLQSFIVPATGAQLGTNGTSFTVSATDDACVVDI